MTRRKQITPAAAKTGSKLIALLLLLALAGCINNSTSNPRVADVTPDTPPGETPEEPPPPSPIDPETRPDTGLMLITGGSGHSCAIKNVDTSLWCWGQNNRSQLGNLNTNTSTSPALTSTENWLAVSAGAEHSCAIRDNGSLWCWGGNDFGQLGEGSSQDRSEPHEISAGSLWRNIAAGADHSCGLKDDQSLWCWGNNDKTQLGHASADSKLPSQLGSAVDWDQLSLGSKFSCAIRALGENDRRLYCWGDNSSGQLGLGTVGASVASPSEVTGASPWSAVSAGGGHSCALQQDQSLWCWGGNSYGQLGQGAITPNPNPTPNQVQSGTKWLAVASGGSHSCAIRDDKSLWCWGDNSAGQLGIASTGHQASPKKVAHDTGWLGLMADANHTCAIDSDHVGYCWGLNDYGQLGNGVDVDTTRPRLFDSSITWDKLSSGRQHSCGLKADMTLWCGGINSFGQLGIGSTANRSQAVQVKGAAGTLEFWQAIDSGQHHSCAIDASNALYCWGKNDRGQLASGTSGNVVQNWTPNSKISLGADDWIGVAAGANHSCAIKNSDQLWCWGANDYGQLGDGSTSSSTSPVQVIGQWQSIAAGSEHSCAVKTDGTLWCWGRNDISQLGDTTINNSSIPVQAGTASDWLSVKAGNRHNCALNSGANLFCWGAYGEGQTGIGPVIIAPNKPTAIAVSGITWSDYDLGENFTCAVTTADKNLYCWGNDSYKQLTADIASVDSKLFTPDKASFFTDWRQVALGMKGGCGIRENDVGDRSAYCWGDGAEYQLGDGSAWKETPQRVPLE